MSVSEVRYLLEGSRILTVRVAAVLAVILVHCWPCFTNSLSLAQIRKPPELPVESLIYTDNPQHTKAANSPPCEHRERQKREPWRAQPSLEEKSVDLTCAEPIVPHRSPPPSVTHPTTSGEVFLRGNVSTVPLLLQKSVGENDLVFSLPKQKGLLWLFSWLVCYLKSALLLSSAYCIIGIGLSLS